MKNQENTMNNPMRFEFTVNEYDLEHFHEEIQLIYVFEGVVDIWIDNEKYILNRDDFLIINSNKLHRFKSSKKSLIGSYYSSYALIKKMMAQSNLVFWCNSTVDKSSAYEEVRHVIKNIVKDFFQLTGVGKIQLISQYYEVLYLITKHFLVTDTDTFNNQLVNLDEERIAFITEYISENHQNKISLSELADKLFLSETYLSKYIKKQFGMNFLEYVNNVRLNHVLENLIYTNHSITRIALENGFNNIGTFNRIFKSKFKQSPKAYRNSLKKNKTEEIVIEENKALEKRVKDYITLNPHIDRVQETNFVTIELDCKNENIIFNKSWGKMINVGTYSDLLKSNLQKHIGEITRKLRFSYVRIWDLYAPEMYIDINVKNQYYNFDKLNRVLDFVTEQGLLPYLELNIKPKKLLKSLKDTLIEGTGETKFESIKSISYFIDGLMLHLINRYGAENIEKWYFEIWKEEPDNIDNSKNSIDNYLKQFDTIAGTIRKYIPKGQVGGGGLSIRFGKQPMKELFEKWKGINSQPNFISFYSFPYIQGELDDIRINKISTDKEYFSNYIETAKDLLNEVGYTDIAIHISEWNSTVSNRNILNDSCYKGAYIMKNLITSINSVELIGYWFASDVFADYYDSNELLNGSSGLVTKDGIAKPAYFALEFLNRLGSKLIGKGDNYIITDAGFNDIRIACHNYKFFNHCYFMMQEDEIDLKEHDFIFEDIENKTLDFVLNIEKKGRYEVKVHAINRQYGSVQDEWIRMACQRNLIQEDINYLKQVCIPRLSIHYVETKDDKLLFSTQMEANEIQFIQVKYKEKL